MKKTLLRLALGLVVLFTLVSIASAKNQQAVRVYLDREQLSFDVPAQIINNRTMVPLRGIFEKLGATVDWNGETKTVVSNRNDVTIQLTIGSPVMYVNGTAITLDTPACVVNKRTLVPVRAISEAFKIEVEWNGTTRCVDLFSKYRESDWDKSSLSNNGTSKTLISTNKLVDEVVSMTIEDDFLVYRYKSDAKQIFGIDINLYYDVTYDDRGWIEDFERISFKNQSETPKLEAELKVPLREIPPNARIQPYVDFVSNETILIDGKEYPLKNDRKLYFCDGLNDKNPIYVDAFEKVFRKDAAPVWEHNKTILSKWKNPAHYLNSCLPAEIVSVSNQICENTVDEYEKIKKINQWVATNIVYDYEYYEGKKTTGYLEPLDVLHHKLTVCEGYANLTRALIQAQNIPCQKVSGYALGLGTKGVWDETNLKITESNHAWNRAYVKNRWVNLDSTWDDGSVRYFDMSDYQFSDTHKIMRIE